MRPQAIFRPGTHIDDKGVARTYSPEQVELIAATYDPAVRPANFTIGHPPDDQPGYGLVAAAFVDADGWLKVVPKNMVESFVRGVNGGEYAGYSASLLPPGHKQNPAVGYYLKHVAAVPLGQQPGVAGQPAQNFCCVQDDGVINFFMPASNATTPDSKSPSSPPDKSAPEAENFIAQQQALATREATIAQREADFTKLQAQNFVKGLQESGKLYADEVAPLTAYLCVQQPQVINFTKGAEAIQQPAVEWLEQFLSRRPALVGASRLLADDPAQAENFSAETAIQKATREAAAAYANASKGED
jgi:hypothetical protein